MPRGVRGGGVSSNVRVQKFCTYPPESLQVSLQTVNICWNLANYCMLSGSALTLPFLKGYWNAKWPRLGPHKVFHFLEAMPLCHSKIELCALPILNTLCCFKLVFHVATNI